MTCVHCSAAPKRFGNPANEDIADFVTLTDEVKKKAEGRVGRAGILVVEATYDAARILKPIAAELGRAVAGSDTKGAAESLIDDVLLEHADDNAIGDAIFVPFIMADMAGQLMVHGREAQRVDLIATGSGQDPRAFLNLPWEEAIAEFKARGLISEDEFSTLLRTYASRSMEARTQLLAQLQRRMRALLATAIEQGQTLREFGDSVSQGIAPLGIDEANPHYLENVFRTNIQAAYGAGRFRAITDPDVIEARPFVQYRTVGDSRVRPAHAALNLLVFEAASAEWRRVAPPNGYRCRCAVVTLDEEEARNLTVVSRLPDDGQPDPDFDGPPVTLVETPLAA